MKAFKLWKPVLGVFYSITSKFHFTLECRGSNVITKAQINMSQRQNSFSFLLLNALIKLSEITKYDKTRYIYKIDFPKHNICINQQNNVYISYHKQKFQSYMSHFYL